MDVDGFFHLFDLLSQRRCGKFSSLSSSPSRFFLSFSSPDPSRSLVREYVVAGGGREVLFYAPPFQAALHRSELHELEDGASLSCGVQGRFFLGQKEGDAPDLLVCSSEGAVYRQLAAEAERRWGAVGELGVASPQQLQCLSGAGVGARDLLVCVGHWNGVVIYDCVSHRLVRLEIAGWVTSVCATMASSHLISCIVILDTFQIIEYQITW